MVEEHTLKLIIVDGKRVIALYDDYPPAELDDPTGEALTDVIDRIRYMHASKIVPDLNPMVEGKPRKAPVQNPVLRKPKNIIDPTSAEEDVIEPAPEKHPIMPKGITRNVAGREHYREFANALLHGTSYRVLRGVADIGKPVMLSDMRKHLADMKGGTVSSQLHGLAERGFLLKQKNATKHALIYTLTQEGEDILTRPEPQRNLL
jgi:DNA-binding HxlR family transcriptional regulator